jgi:hypothetical protein
MFCHFSVLLSTTFEDLSLQSLQAAVPLLEEAHRRKGQAAAALASTVMKS